MRLLALAMIMLFFPAQDDKKPTKRDNPKTAIKAVLEEASDLYKKQIKALQSAKTSADKTNALDAAKTGFQDWKDTIDELPVVFDARVIDVTKNKATDTYYVVLEQGKDLQKFVGNTITPTLACRNFSIEINEEQSKTTKIGSRLTVRGTLSPSTLYAIDNSGDAVHLDFNIGCKSRAPRELICLVTFNYSQRVFMQQSYNIDNNTPDFVTFLLDDAAIVFDDSKP